MSKVLIIGAGGVGGVVTHKCAQAEDVFSEICLASRTKSKCDAIASGIDRPIRTEQVDADNVSDLVRLIQDFKPDVLINVALPYQDLTIMEACLETGVDYVDTANYESPEEARFSYEFQWPYHARFQEKGVMALLGSGFDPGVTNVFCAYAQKHHFDEIHYVDILDANGGDHGYPFATNFNPEINIREITANGRYWENGSWVETRPLEIHQTFNFPEIGDKEMYLLYHEEMESLVQHLNGLKRIRFWMTFSQKYITHLEVLQNVGMTRIDPVQYNGTEIVPLQFLRALLPDPASLGPRTVGKTNIGCIVRGMKDGKPKAIYIYNVCDHQECYREVKSQAISYTTGVPAMIGAMMVATKQWKKSGVFNMEQMDPDPFLEQLAKYGLPWNVVELDPNAIPLQL
jgi:saccharopine dehydrogenase (NAD+, L-lysine forming)